jgi:hypothetical protein
LHREPPPRIWLVSIAFRAIARSAQWLQVAICVRTTNSQRGDVIYADVLA